MILYVIKCYVISFLKGVLIGAGLCVLALLFAYIMTINEILGLFSLCIAGMGVFFAFIENN